MPKKGVLEYEFKGYNRVGNALRKLAREFNSQLDGTVSDWTKNQRAEMKSFGYPPQTNAPQPFKTDRQRRWFFWALSTGVITVPYVRTGLLASSWAAVKQGDAEWTLQNSAPYSPWVIGLQQANFHRGNWWIADEVIKERTSELTEQLTEDIVSLASGMDGGVG